MLLRTVRLTRCSQRSARRWPTEDTVDIAGFGTFSTRNRPARGRGGTHAWARASKSSRRLCRRSRRARSFVMRFGNGVGTGKTRLSRKIRTMAREIIFGVVSEIVIVALARSSADVPICTYGLRPRSRQNGALGAGLVGSTWKGPSLTRRHESSPAKVSTAMSDTSTRCAISVGSRLQGHRGTVPVHIRRTLGLSEQLGPSR